MRHCNTLRDLKICLDVIEWTMFSVKLVSWIYNN